MYLLITTFYISFIGIITMILIKRAEIKHGKSTFSESSIEKNLTKTYLSLVRFFRLFNKHTFIALSQYLTFHLLFRVRKIYVELKHRTLLNPHGKKMIDAVRGRGEVKNHGASFYLRRISGK
jgi:preprotein translocase subunit SecG